MKECQTHDGKSITHICMGCGRELCPSCVQYVDIDGSPFCHLCAMERARPDRERAVKRSHLFDPWYGHLRTVTIFIFVAVFGFFLAKQAVGYSKQPESRPLLKSKQVVAMQFQNFEQVAGALEQYKRFHSSYPRSLFSLSPQWLPEDILTYEKTGTLVYARKSPTRFVLYQMHPDPSVGKWVATEEGFNQQ